MLRNIWGFFFLTPNLVYYSILLHFVLHVMTFKTFRHTHIYIYMCVCVCVCVCICMYVYVCYIIWRPWDFYYGMFFCWRWTRVPLSESVVIVLLVRRPESSRWRWWRIQRLTQKLKIMPSLYYAGTTPVNFRKVAGHWLWKPIMYLCRFTTCHVLKSALGPYVP